MDTKLRHKITPNLWFDRQAEEAARFYTSVFDNSSIGRITRYDSATSAMSGLPEGSVLTVEFELDGQPFVALNGGPIFSFTEAVSFIVDCDSQEEVDYFWNALTDGGEESQCGWLKDRYGLSWQIVPAVLGELLSDPDDEKSQRVTQALLGMRKLDIAELQRAYEGANAD
jgi:predicted 3-demethylubiquinone-9 3-methyltransferase (glyoxalase superfamily)